ncbi:glycosyltransferase [Clostridium aestuarii]|uniref:Glycosyltransferase n=1 Tax=Clostridium aestuarii TaxID=338193 RepID=A0ABT4CXE8_9CLOT|nr:glycosyltransferase family 2 protein [Clostridium aestuarii]MCY6483673.1 glycosyltransferase [Clostridium aestuarii]
MLSLCMIVKNEEENLKECLEKLELYIDDIVIIDTGSTDKTKEIAAEFTDEIYDFKWCNDFAAARNFSLSKASNDWILVIDADEILTEFCLQRIIKFIENKNNQRTVGRIKIVNLFEEKIGIERVSRIFNRNYYHYEGIVHEQVTSLNSKNYKTADVDIIVEHMGYTQEMVHRKDKIKRNITLLNKILMDNPDDSYIYYQLGKAYYMEKDYTEACNNFIKALNLLSNYAYEYVEDLVESYGYALTNCGRFNDALVIQQYGIYYDTSPDYNFLMGLIYMNNAKFALAVESFIKCIGNNEGKIYGINSYLPNYNIGIIFECLGYREECLEYYRKCDDYQPAVKRIKTLLN